MDKNIKALGFSLIELLVVLALIGILSAIGLPSYRQYQLRAVATEGALSLLSMSSVQERARLNSGRYLDQGQLELLVQLPARVREHFQLLVSIADKAQTYTLELIPKETTSALEIISLNSRGLRRPASVWP